MTTISQSPSTLNSTIPFYSTSVLKETESQVGSQGGPAPQTAGDVEDGSPAGALIEATIAERQQVGNPTSQPDQSSDSTKNDYEAKNIESNSDVYNEEQLQIQPKKLGSVVATTSHPEWNADASPYCPQNGRPHSILVDFGCSSCPICKQILLAKSGVGDAPGRNPSDDGNTKSVDDHLIQPDTAPEDTSKESRSTSISYMVEYRDARDFWVTNERWSGPFDLAAARKDVGESKSPIFDVVTILRTTISPDVNMYSTEGEYIKSQGILNNPKIGITVQGSKVIIHSQNIIKAIASVASYYPSVNLKSAEFEIEEPYPLIAHHIDELEALAPRADPSQGMTSPGDVETPQAGDISKASPENEKTDLRLLLDFTIAIYKDHIKNEKERYEHGSCTFRMLWLLFKPGDTVYCQFQGHLAAFVVQEVSKGPGLSDFATKDSYTVRLWYLEFDGEFVGRHPHDVQIAHFEGERAIKTLKAFPCKYIDMYDGGDLRKKLEMYGKRWYELLTGRQIHYSGKMWEPPNKDCNGRAYIDTRSYYSQHPEAIPTISNIEDMGKGLALCPCEECLGCRAHPPEKFRWSQYDVIDPWKIRNLETDGSGESPKHRYLLCSRKLHGFVLKTRTWERLDVANCSIPETDKEAIQRLVMPQDRKTLIEALVQRFTNHGAAVSEVTKPWRADHIEGKGEGQIFLLHGGPGVGKTFIKSIAEYTGRALLSLTSGDLGTTDRSVETALNVYLTLAEVWGAIVLIDEADVYLEKRQRTDLQRNSLVSVFLRSIEYYRGILFLTTNRVGTFDDAFMSRIHVVIAYDDLGDTERKTIWKQFFDKLTRDRREITITKRAKTYVLEDSEMVNVGWNGREIRNAFQTAVALADYRAQKEGRASDPVLDLPDFEHVLNLTSEFKAYLARIDGIDEASRAFRARNRAPSGH